MTQHPEISTNLALARGIKCKCPKCGEGNLFTGILKPASKCRACGLDYSFFDIGDGGIVFVIMIVGFFITGSALYANIIWEWAIWKHLLVWPALTIFLSIALLRPLKGCLITLQYAYKAANGNEKI